MSRLPRPENRVYTDPGVYHRFLEFLGGDLDQEVTAVYVTHTDGCLVLPDRMRDAGELLELMEKRVDIDRSLLDKSSLLVHLDIEYVNFDSPAECYLNPGRSFALQEPVIEVIEEQLVRFGIRPLHLLTGQGHHFVWRIEEGSHILDEIRDMATEERIVSDVYPESSVGLREHTANWEKAFHSLGRIMEFLAHEIKRNAADQCEIPVEITATHVGGGKHGKREMVSIDISEYGDPIWTRVIRLPFSNYLKPWKNGLFGAVDGDDERPPIFTIPFHEVDIASALQIRNSVEKTISLAHRSCVRIPEQTNGMLRLVEAYRRSSLWVFHEFYAAAPLKEGETISLVRDEMPPCARHVIDYPNDLLLKPSGMRLLTKCLLGLGFSACSIAHMIAQIFRDEQHGWGRQWDIYSPDMRAHFYTRLFAGQVFTGLDQAVDFNCVSTQEQGFCFDAHGCNLKPWRDKLVSKQKEEML